MNKNISSISFFFPYKEVSGVPVLFLTMAKYISEHYDIKLRIIDYADGYMARNIKNDSHIKIVIFEDGIPCNVNQDTILVIQSILPYAMRPELKIHPDTKIVFWHLFHYNLINILFPLKLIRNYQFKNKSFYKTIMNIFRPTFKKNLQDFLNLLITRKAILFYDNDTLDTTADFLGFEIKNPIFVSIPIDTFRAKGRKQVCNKEHLHFAWIGRLCDFKIYILIYTIKKLSEYAITNKKTISFHIIGDGPEAFRLEKLNVENEFFKIINVGVVESKNLDDYLLKNIDILCAMGTSALEGAKLGIPVILMDITYYHIKGGYKFRWLFDTKGNDLGHYLKDDDFENNSKSLDKIMDSIYNKYSLVAQKTLQYCIENHDIEIICNKFLDAIQNTSLCFGDISPAIVKKGFVRQLYEYFKYSYK